MGNFASRVVRAAKFDASLYKEIASDENALGQAIGVVVLASIASGLRNIRDVQSGMFYLLMLSLIGWLILAYIIYFIGTKLVSEPQTKSSLSELLRTTGFSHAPGLIGVLGIIPYLGIVVLWVTSLWMLVALVVAVRQAFDYKSMVRAVLVSVVGWIIHRVIMVFFIVIIFDKTPKQI